MSITSTPAATTPAATPTHVLLAAVHRGLDRNTAKRLAHKYRFLRSPTTEFLQEVEAAIGHDPESVAHQPKPVQFEEKPGTSIGSGRLTRTDGAPDEAQAEPVEKPEPAGIQTIELIAESEPAQPAEAACSATSELTLPDSEPVAQLGPCESLHRAGFEVIPIIPPGASISPKSTIKGDQCGKIPGLKGRQGWHGFDWRRHQTVLAEAQQWDRDGAGVGIRCGRVIGIDIDVLDRELAIEMRALAIRMLGDAPSRTGRAPKVLLPYRLDGQRLSKRAISWTCKEGKAEKVEILGNGQQFVALGIHPGTLKPYIWDRELTNPDDLPAITEEQLVRFLEEAETLLAQHGIQATRSGQGRLAGRDVAPPKEELLAPRIDDLREIVAGIRNSEEADRDEWLWTGIAIKAAAGRDHEAEGFELFLGYSDRWEGGVNDPEYVRTTWDSFAPPFSIGWGYLLDRAQEQGFNTAVYEFEPLQTATPPASREPSTPEGGCEPLPTEGERIAALLHDAGAAFLAEVDTLPEGRLAARWQVLRAAAETTDRMEGLFLDAIVPEAERLRQYKKHPQFARLLESRLRNNPAWKALESDLRALLLRAAFVLVVGPIIQPPELELVRPGTAPLRELVTGLLPDSAVGVIVGPPNVGKSFVAADLAARVASGAKMFGPNLEITRHGPALYLTSEDPEGLVTRLEDWSGKHQLPVTRVFVYNSTLNLTDFERALEEVQSAVTKVDLGPDRPALIVIDTVRDALGGADENDAGVMAYAVKVARTIGRMVGATVLLVAHTPYGDTTRPRGSSAFPAAVDVILSVEQKDSTITATVTKRRRGPKGERLTWHLQVDGVKAVLHPGPDGSDDELIGGTAQVEQDARVAYEALSGIASMNNPASWRQLSDELQARCEALRDRVGVPRTTTASRRQRAAQKAVDLKWITVRLVRGRKEYVPGPERPASEPLTPANLARVEG
jgi:KaiC/GvpD/RAD55 family RecA-like ATPase